MVDVVAVGEILIDLVATRPDVTLYEAPAFEPKPGGAPANVAVGVARLGGRAAFVGKVGADAFGQGLRDLFYEPGTSRMYPQSRRASGATYHERFPNEIMERNRTIVAQP